MRSTRASAAVARLNERSATERYFMVLLGNGRFELRERVEGGENRLSEPLELDDFVRFVNTTGPQKAPRVTKNDAAFAKQLQRKPKAPA